MNLTVLYKNKYRKIHKGIRGGRYLLINNKKIYLTKNKVRELLKNKKKVSSNYLDKRKKILENKKVKNEPNVVISYNLSWATQKDVISGSEIKHVKKCVEKYGEKAIPYKKLSGCTDNLVNNILLFNKKNPTNTFDIFCAQEGTKEYVDLIYNKLNKSKKYNICKSFISRTLLWTIYKKSFGKPTELFKGHFKNHKGRPIQILYFKNINLILINAHFPHEVEIKQLIKINILPYIKMYLNKSRIIFCGDFNDSNSQLIKENDAELKLDNIIMKTENAKNVKSCCYNSNFTDIGDYIFDSKKINYFGIIPIFNKIKLASDHKPVISINNLQINLN